MSNTKNHLGTFIRKGAIGSPEITTTGIQTAQVGAPFLRVAVSTRFVVGQSGTAENLSKVLSVLVTLEMTGS